MFDALYAAGFGVFWSAIFSVDSSDTLIFPSNVDYHSSWITTAPTCKSEKKLGCDGKSEYMHILYMHYTSYVYCLVGMVFQGCKTVLVLLFVLGIIFISFDLTKNLPTKTTVIQNSSHLYALYARFYLSPLEQWLN